MAAFMERNTTPIIKKINGFLFKVLSLVFTVGLNGWELGCWDAEMQRSDVSDQSANEFEGARCRVLIDLPLHPLQRGTKRLAGMERGLQITFNL
jgi:hypothetical protein